MSGKAFCCYCPAECATEELEKTFFETFTELRKRLQTGNWLRLPGGAVVHFTHDATGLSGHGNPFIQWDTQP